MLTIRCRSASGGTTILTPFRLQPESSLNVAPVEYTSSSTHSKKLLHIRLESLTKQVVDNFRGVNPALEAVYDSVLQKGERVLAEEV